MTNIKLFDTGKVFKLAKRRKRVKGKDQRLYVFESWDKGEVFNFEVGEVRILQDGRVFNVEFLDVKVVLSFKEEIFIEFIVKRGATEAVLEIVH